VSAGRYMESAHQLVPSTPTRTGESDVVMMISNRYA
jgi:hypothetical protein